MGTTKYGGGGIRYIIAFIHIAIAWIFGFAWNVSRVYAGGHDDCGSRGWHPYQFQKRNDLDLKRDLNFTGWNYAGRGEFPWLVEIRKRPGEEYLAQEDWANGNMLTSTHILTTCKVAGKLQLLSTDTNPQGTVYYHRVTKKDPKDYIVMFSEDYPYKTPGSNTGSRDIRQFHVHPNCTTLSFDYHYGIVEVKVPIHPNPPWIGMINVDFNYEGYNAVIKSYCDDGSTSCYIGLWGRFTRSSLSLDLLWNYKIKYLVHPIDPLNCTKYLANFPHEYHAGPPFEDWDCMGIHRNETTGSICDRDRGAPIVCGGVVRAIMLAGVRDEFCNRTDPMPFLVADIRTAFNMFAELDVRAFKSSNLSEFGRYGKD